MTEPELLILSSLAEQPKHGYAIIKDVLAFAAVRLGPGTLYTAIGRLEAAGLVTPMTAMERRRPYALTEAGRTRLGVELDRLDAISHAVRRRVGWLTPRIGDALA